MALDGKALVRLAQLRGRIAALARGGRFELAGELLGELTRADLALGLPADGLLRARQAAQLADERGEPLAGPLLVLAATLLAAGAHDDALVAANAALERATAAERPRTEVIARLVGGAAQRRARRNAEARLLLDSARGTAARLGEAALAGFALIELAWLDLGEDRAPAAATCFEFAAEFLRRGKQASSAIEADALAIAAWASTDDADALAMATSRAPAVVDAARAAGRGDLVAYVDGVLADLALARAPDAAIQATALAAESAHALPDSPIARELAAAARLRQARAADDPRDRARHLEAGIELAVTLERGRAGLRLGSLLMALVDEAARRERAPDRGEIERVAAAIVRLGDAELEGLARDVVAELA